MQALIAFFSDEKVLHALSLISTQILTFLIFFFIVKRFIWPPLMGVLEERRNKIEEEMKKIEGCKLESEKMKAEYQALLKQSEIECKQKVMEQVEHGRWIATKVTDKAHLEAKEIVTKAHEQIHQEIEKAKLQLREETVSMVMQLSEKVLKESFDENTKKGLNQKIIKELEGTYGQ